MRRRPSRPRSSPASPTVPIERAYSPKLQSALTSMASYVETIVGPGEHIVHVGRVSLLAILSSLVGGALLIVVAIALLLMPVGSPDVTRALAGITAALGVLVIVIALVRRSSTELAVTNRRVIAKYGLIARRTIEMN